ncbi:MULTISPECIES: OmpA family protein [Flavobacteriaceae]|uniref:OmpA family protein n=2 Tax=Flavobacteriaceae TaxID=49546 RepID=A0A4Y8ARM5_9FLAO|nr:MULTISPECIES: OmpA family protein [Flavobacteriaceae]TEW73841.1 OmpA family protein [Gramella jeungdoensis]GGK38030.1 cell envelope biogenesis protein OmpA [Lutibacter litoralis]
MKHLKIAILALLVITSFSNANAQDKENPWMLNFGTNAIDISTNSDATSGYFGSYKFDGNDVNVIPWLSRVSLTRYIGKGFGLELAGAMNKVDRPWGTGSDVTFFGLDLNVKYDLNNAFGQTGWFDPFLYTGIGENWVGSENGLGLNLGAGFNAWISDNVGINFTSGYKKVNTPVDFKMFQHSVGLTWKFGNKDRDGDGVNNKEDKCPDEAGLAEFGGCLDTDADKDGVTDCCDKCPEVPGLAEFDGCPDTDGDGVQDSKDKCPTVAGLKALHGCPDQDGDGVADGDDACIDVPGPKGNSGCPYKDTDQDGVIDIIDRCVETPGPASNEGCPVDPSSDVMAELNRYGKTILFDTAKATFKGEAINTLETMVTILKKYPDTDFVVEGHTDNVGTERSNQLLSERRASAVRDHLVSKGINPDRLSYEGFGESRPIDSNDTASGRANNRRTEVNIKK